MNSRQEYVETCLAFHKDFKKKCDRFKFYYVKDEFGDRVGVVVGGVKQPAKNVGKNICRRPVKNTCNKQISKHDELQNGSGFTQFACAFKLL